MMVAVGKWETRRVFQGHEVTVFSTAFRARQTELLRCSISETAVRANRVVVNTPDLDVASGIGDRDEPVFIQAGIPKFAVVAFDKSVLCRFAGLNEVKLHAALLGPEKHRLARELRTVVGDDLLR